MTATRPWGSMTDAEAREALRQAMAVWCLVTFMSGTYR